MVEGEVAVGEAEGVVEGQMEGEAAARPIL